MKTTLLLPCALALLLLAGCATPPPARTFAEPADLPASPALPDPLLTLDGDPVHNRAQWERVRRPELQALFTHYMYGPIPPAPARLHSRVTAQYPDFLGGQATLKLITLTCGPETNAPAIDLMLVLPNGRSTPAPVFLVMNFCGNHTASPDPRIPLTRTWLYDNCPGSHDHYATDLARGLRATNWPIETIIARGYALATFCSADLDADRKDASIGLYQWLAQGDPARNPAAHRGTLAAWAWGFQRSVDHLLREPRIDPRKIATVGHSRNGKTSLLAAAYDPRIAMAFAHQAGCGGTAPSRGQTGESVKAINTSFPHWFNARFKQFNDAPEKLPFDQHALLALCAPRPVLVSAATEDQWSNPAGQFQMTVAASPVYRLYGYSGVTAPSQPPPGQLVGDRLAYYLREGRHSMTAADWLVFLDFADKHWLQ